MRQKLNLAAVGVLAGVIAYLSTVPYTGTGGGSGPNLAIFKHAVAYFVLSAALLAYFHDTRRGHIEAVIVASGFGLLLELTQVFLPTRTFALKDAAVNGMGAAIVFLDHRSHVFTRIIEVEDRVIEGTIEKLF